MQIHRMRRTIRGVVVGAAGAVALTVAAPAGAAPTGVYSDFAACPVSDPDVASCLISDTTSGSIKLGNQNVPVTKRIRLQGGLKFDPETFASTFVPASNGKTLDAPPLSVPGGLLGITVPSQVPQPARGLLEAAINTTNGVTATAQLVGPAAVDFQALLDGSKPAVTLPLRVKLDNPFLGSNCYIGSAAAPVRFRLTNGTTAPPAGVAPITGNAGIPDGIAPDISIIRGQTLVDNTFSTPRASGCGGIFSLVIDPVVNLKIGLPAAPGKSVARLTGDARLAPADSVRASSR